MMLKEKYLLGYLKKTHGLKGDLIFIIKESLFDEFLNKELVFVELDNLPVPFFIEHSKQYNNNSIIVKLEDVDTLEYAERFIGKKVFTEKTLVSDKAINDDYNNLINLKVETVEGDYLGTIKEFIDYENNPLLKVSSDKYREILIPANEVFITNITKDKLTVNLPDGFLDIYE